MQLLTQTDAGALPSPPVASSQFWKQPFRVPASSDPDTATGQTIGIMCGHIKGAAADDLVRQTAAGAVNQFASFAGGSDAQALAAAAWWWCKVYVRFVHHEFIIRQKLGEAGHLQGLISPEVLVRMDRPEGDCAIFSECVCAFLRVLGVPYELVTVAVNPREPKIFSHVYCYAVLPDGSRLPLDASHGDYPGWQVPSSDVFRVQVWDENGRPVADRGSRFDGLHNYGLRGLGAILCDADGNCGEQVSAFDPNACTCMNGTCLENGNSCGAGASMTPPFIDTGSPAFTAPSQNSAQWAAFATNLAKMGFTLAQINSIQPGTVVSANGAILRQNPGYSVPAGGSISAGLGGNTLLYLGLGAALLVGVSAMGGKR